MKGFNFYRNINHSLFVDIFSPKFKKGWKTIYFSIIGLGSLTWFLIRVIPKPSRATYPCMKVAAPLASTFVIYLTGLITSVFTYTKGKNLLKQSRYSSALIFFLTSLISSSIIVYTQFNFQSYAKTQDIREFNDPLGPNHPIGEAKGIFPGRVVWIHHPDATNENCTNSSHSDAYWLSQNTNQNIVDSMFSEGIQSLTHTDTDSLAWEMIFRYFNKNHSKGTIGYRDNETIFIKINAVTAWGGAAPTGEMPASTEIEYDTTPQAIMAMLRQLVYKAGVPEENIYIGDPMADIWNHLYNYFYSEFPNIHYCSKWTIPGRYKLTASSEDAIYYSDHSTVMDQINSHRLFDEMMNADYLLNIPSMKQHRWGGITLFAKNHFGSNTSDGSWQLHKGLMNPDNSGMRYGYNLYRVFVDMMGHKYLGGNTLLYFMDALWSTSSEHQKPQKFQTDPFNNDWSSSLIFSLDPVAVESVCLDILQKEFTEEDLTSDPARHTYVQWDGVDDYLHQAADSSWWPDNIEYDPENDGTTIGSLGVHEHWNTKDDMQYLKNLYPDTTAGIELIKIFHTGTVNISDKNSLSLEYSIKQNYPNPFNARTNIEIELKRPGKIRIEIYNSIGQLVETLTNRYYSAGKHSIVLNANSLASGTYYYRFTTDSYSITKKMTLIK